LYLYTKFKHLASLNRLFFNFFMLDFNNEKQERYQEKTAIT